MEKALEWGDRIPLGVFYNNEHVPDMGERIRQRIPTYYKYTPAEQGIAGPNGEPLTDLSKLFAKLTVQPTV